MAVKRKRPDAVELYCRLNASVMESHLEILERLQVVESKLGIKQKFRVSKGKTRQEEGHGYY